MIPPQKSGLDSTLNILCTYIYRMLVHDIPPIGILLIDTRVPIQRYRYIFYHDNNIIFPIKISTTAVENAVRSRLSAQLRRDTSCRAGVKQDDGRSEQTHTTDCARTRGKHNHDNNDNDKNNGSEVENVHPTIKIRIQYLCVESLRAHTTTRQKAYGDQIYCGGGGATTVINKIYHSYLT